MNSMLYDGHGNLSYSPDDDEDYDEELYFDEDAHKYYDDDEDS